MKLLLAPYNFGYRLGQYIGRHPISLLWGLYVFFLVLDTLWILITITGALILVDFSILLPVFPFALITTLFGWWLALNQLVKRLDGE